MTFAQPPQGGPKAGAVILPFPQPAARFVRSAVVRRSAAVRGLIENEIERLICLLDMIDGDPDAEDDGTVEPSLGWTKTMALGTRDDREDDPLDRGERSS